MTATFKIEQILTVKEKTYVLAKWINVDMNFFLTDHSYLGSVAIEKWMDIPRAHDENENLRKDYFAFVLKNSEDGTKFKEGDTVTLWDDYVTVVDSFRLSDGRIVVFLKCYPGKLDTPFEVSDDATNNRWLVQRYLRSTGSFESYQIINNQEKENIFQYLMQCINNTEKPLKDTTLKIIR